MRGLGFGVQGLGFMGLGFRIIQTVILEGRGKQLVLVSIQGEADPVCESAC